MTQFSTIGGNDGRHIFSNLHSSRLRRAGTPEPPPKRMAAGSVQIHGKVEYMNFLSKLEIEHDVKYVFEWLE